MIERERLQELINQGATIYEVKYGKVNPVSLKNKIRFVSEKYPVIAFEPRPNEKYKHHKYFDKLYETQEKAEWVAKIHTERTEKFEPPVYEEWLKREIFEFYSKDHKNYAISVCLEFDFFESPAKDYIEITNLNDFDHHKLFCVEKTKDNYIKACEYARNLFLGKENDNETDSDR